MFTNFAVTVTMALLDTETLDASANDMTITFDITSFANVATGLD